MDLMKKFDKPEQVVQPVVEAPVTEEVVVEPVNSDLITEVQASQEAGKDGLNDPSSWTPESMEKEIKKLREENKHSRLKQSEMIKQLKEEQAAMLAKKEEEYQAAVEAQKELARIKAEQEDQQRSLEEKLAHREKLLAEIEAQKEAVSNQTSKKLSELESKLAEYEAEKEAQLATYTSKLQEELVSIPEKFRNVAELIAKGAGDPREALIAVTEAKLSGVFEDKTVHVNHSVPGASGGARTTQANIEEARRKELDKMTSAQKYKEAFKQIRAGEANPAFKK